MGEDEEPYYEDPSFYAGINAGIFATIESIWDLVDRGNGTQQQQPTAGQPPQDMKNLYLGMGVLGFFVLIVLVIVILKK